MPPVPTTALEMGPKLISARLKKKICSRSFHKMIEGLCLFLFNMFVSPRELQLIHKSCSAVCSALLSPAGGLFLKGRTKITFFFFSPSSLCSLSPPPRPLSWFPKHHVKKFSGISKPLKFHCIYIYVFFIYMCPACCLDNRPC